MTPHAIQTDLTTRFADIIPTSSWGETSFFYNPGAKLKRGVYFATIKEKDGENDRASDLNRDGVWRFNLGLPPKLFEEHFGPRPARPAKGGIIAGDWAFTAADVVTPHPVYGWMGWVAVLNPSKTTYEGLSDWISEAFGKAKMNAEKRILKEVG
ncbi:MAG: DUF6194 family protein [Pseudomonadota bacterium]